MIRITQDISTEPVTITDVKQFIKFSDTDTAETSLIEDMIKGARVYLEKRTGLALAQKTIIEYFNQEYLNEYVLSIAPVISVDSVEVLDVEEESTPQTLNTNYFLRGLYERIITINVASVEQLKVTYKAGYGESETEDLPYDLKQAVLRQVIQWYDNRDEFINGVYMDQIGDIIRMYNRKW